MHMDKKSQKMDSIGLYLGCDDLTNILMCCFTKVQEHLIQLHGRLQNKTLIDMITSWFFLVEVVVINVRGRGGGTRGAKK